MDKEWTSVIISLITVFGTLAGVAVGSAFSIWIKKSEFKHQITEENRKLRLSKLEQLYERVTEFTPISTECVAEQIDMKRSGNRSIKDYSDINSKLSHASNKIATILKIYAPEFKSEFAEFNKSIIELITFSAEFRIQEKISSTGFNKCHDKVCQNCFALQVKIEEKIRKEIFST